MNMVERIRKKAKLRLVKNDDGHGFDHAERVFNLADEIRRREGGDKLVIAAACYMHDWCTYGGREYHVSGKAMREIEKELRAIGFPDNKISFVVDAVRHHEDYNFRKRRIKLLKEGQILQDADRLDAIGAIGIGRCFYTTAVLKHPFGTLDEMKRLKENYHIGQITSAIRHFYTKLLNLKDSMNTKYARGLARERHDYMVEFLRRLKLEWYGKI